LPVVLAGLLALMPACRRSGTTDGGAGQDSDTGQVSQSEGEQNDSAEGLSGGASRPSTALIADHVAAAQFDRIPASYVQAAHARFHVFFGHTSHGSQIVTGLQMLARQDARFAFNAGAGTLALQEEEGDLGSVWDLPDPQWVEQTRRALERRGNKINIVVWSWCGGVSDNTPEGISAYLAQMAALERQYPSVVFVYMTGHLDGTGRHGNLWARNDQIRNHCRARGRVLFDFADIESYDPQGNLHADGTDWCEWCEAWCRTHSCPSCDECAHSVCFNCYQKGRAFWWLLARLAGWEG